MIEIFLLFTTFLFFFFSTHLWKENKELKEKLIKNEKKTTENLKKEKDTYSIKKISNENIPPKSTESLKKEFQDIQKVIEKSSIKENSSEKVYTIPKKESPAMNTLKKNNISNIEEEQLNFSDFIQNSKPLPTENINPNSQQMDYIKNLSQKLEQEIKPQTIELTDYEKKQEETAIISYKELLSSSKKQDKKEEYDEKELLEELKQFRNYLN